MSLNANKFRKNKFLLLHGVLEKDEQNLGDDEFENEDDALTTGTQNVKERIKLMSRCHKSVKSFTSGNKSEFLLSPRRLPRLADQMTLKHVDDVENL